ncbi:acyl carrier protein [Streptomyces sp. NPDC048481]|uniref:acyl carrier protein n=1 Tax=Streptomyces sp. NPDC048481 TaxID=3365557 RepID=UPI0037148AD9
MWDSEFEQLLRRHTPFIGPDEPLTEDLPLKDLGLDSMATVELLAELEAAYGVRFSNDAMSMERFATPGKLWQTLTEVQAAA